MPNKVQLKLDAHLFIIIIIIKPNLFSFIYAIEVGFSIQLGVLCVHWIITSPSLHGSIGREYVSMCVCSSTNSKHFLFRADYGRLLLIGLVDGLCVFFVVIYLISFHRLFFTFYHHFLFVVRFFCPHF